MFELGAESRTEHEAILTLLKDFNFSDVILIGPRFKEASSDSGFHCFGSTDEAYDWLVANPIHNAKYPRQRITRNETGKTDSGSLHDKL